MSAPTIREAAGMLADTGMLNADPCLYQARVRPNKLACVDASSGARWSYRELDARTARIAGFLAARLGDARGERIAFLGRNCLDEIALFLACQRAGAIFVPLNWRLTGTEIGHLVEDSTPRLFIYSDEFADAARDAAKAHAETELVTQDDFTKAADAATPLTAMAEVPGDAPVNLLYTSGTTGRSKGAIITRRGAAFAALNFGFVGELSTTSVLMSDAPLFHTVALYGATRSALTFGATVVITDRLMPGRTLTCLSDKALAVTHYFGVPQIADLLLHDPGFEGSDLSHLKAIFVGGAPLPDHLLHAYLDRNIVLVNGFGMSESGTTMHMPIDKHEIRAHPGCVGLCAPFMEAKIVDADGHDLPDGEAGELWLRGPAVTPGYWNLPEATAASFSGDWFRTGDIARRETSGYFRLIDRLKDMYITGGENVYPAEVEAAIAAHPGIADVAVIGVPDARWGEKGVAYIARDAGADVSEADVRALCEKLARYKRPAEIVFTDAIPRTASGKIQKPALRRLHTGKAAP